MKEESQSKKAPLFPEGQSRGSYMLNGMGNGSMIAFIGCYVVNHAHTFITKKPLYDKEGFALAAISTIGGAIGAAYGYHEGNIVTNYRNRVADKINGMQNDLDSSHAKIAELYSQVQAHANGHAKAR